MRFPVGSFWMRLFRAGKFAITPRGDIEGITRGYDGEKSPFFLAASIAAIMDKQKVT